MPAKLYVVHGSHPCKTVERALDLKGVAYTKVELPPPAHAAIMRTMFPGRTVPGIRFEDGEKVQGSRAILARLEDRAPEPALLPADAEARAKVLEAERWGDEILQHQVRQVLWPTLAENARHAPTLTEGGKLPLPGFVLSASMPLIARIEYRLNQTDKATRDRVLRELPAHLDRIDAWIADGVLGGEQLNRADLQIGPSLALLSTMQDLGDVIAARPCGRVAAKFPTAGHIPAGALPANLVPTAPPAVA